MRRNRRGASYLPHTGGVKQVLNQNQFGGVIGGPIKKDKLFIFGSYQGTRQKNGLASQGVTTRPAAPDSGRRSPVRSGFRGSPWGQVQSCPANHAGDNNFKTPSGSQNVLCDGSNISPVALNILNIKLPNGQYYIPGSGVAGYKQATFTSPAIYNGDQGLVNFDYLITPKNTLAGRWFYTNDPQVALAGRPASRRSPAFSVLTT